MVTMPPAKELKIQVVSWQNEIRTLDVLNCPTWFHWRADNDKTLSAGFFQGIRTSTAKEPYSIVIFQGESGPLTPPPSGSAHVVIRNLESIVAKLAASKISLI